MRREVDARTVELCGSPGVGKSFIAGSLADHLVARGVHVTQPLGAVAPTRPFGRRVWAKALIASREIARAPVGSAQALVAISRSDQSPHDVLHRSLNWLVVRGLYRRARRRPGVHVFDQGVVQELCSIGYQGGDWHACLVAAQPGRARLTPSAGIIDHSVGQPAAQRSSAVPTRAHQSGGQPFPDCPAHGQHPTRSPPP